MEHGKIISGFTSKMWIERYGKEGEFTLVAPVSSGMKDILPLGTFISHVDSTDIMIVENHEINDVAGSESIIKITGRGFETLFEQRIIGSNFSWTYDPVITPENVSTYPIVNYPLGVGYTWNQAVDLIYAHVSPSKLPDSSDYLLYIETFTDVIKPGVSVYREIAIDSLYNALINLLKFDNLGIKVVRPGVWSPLAGITQLQASTCINIHNGLDRTKDVVFSYDTGEIVTADYFWSNRTDKNAAFVVGTWMATRVVNPPIIGLDRRMMLVNAKDIDQAYKTDPALIGDHALYNSLVLALQQRGRDALAAKKPLTLTKAGVSKQYTKAAYRKDFNVGDLIMVHGNYNEASPMRVTEYVELEDATGESSYPTLAKD